MDRTNFPLPTLGPRLDQIKEDVYEGRGFAILRGLDVDSFSENELVVIYLGITSYVAKTRGKQNQRGDMLSTSAPFPHSTQAPSFPFLSSVGVLTR